MIVEHENKSTDDLEIQDTYHEWIVYSGIFRHGRDMLTEQEIKRMDYCLRLVRSYLWDITYDSSSSNSDLA